MCEVCREDKFNKIIGMQLVVQRENPEAYGYPEIVYWKNNYEINTCPVCGRELKIEKHEIK